MTDNNTEFDFQKALKGIQEGKPFTGKDGVLTSLCHEATTSSGGPRKVLPSRRELI